MKKKRNNFVMHPDQPINPGKYDEIFGKTRITLTVGQF